MFTGIIEEIGTIRAIAKSREAIRITIAGKQIFHDMHIGDSIAVNGVCLTVSDFTADSFTADVMPETVNLTNLQFLSIGSSVNLERAMLNNGRFGGHIVSGHIDGIGKVRTIKKVDNATIFTIEADPEISKFIIYKGSVTLNGASLTVIEVKDTSFSVSVIPHTLHETLFRESKVGSLINIETDMLGRYIYKFMSLEEKSEKKSLLTKEKLMENGFF